MSKQKPYSRQTIGRCIIKALQKLGGSASKQQIKEEIVADPNNGITYENVYIPVVSSKSGNSYIPFEFDFNFALKELYILGYIKRYNRTTDVTLTENGRKANSGSYPSEKDIAAINRYWEQKHKEFEMIKNNDQDDFTFSLTPESGEEEKKEDDLISADDLQSRLLALIKNFSPKKFESFSRKLFSKMRIVFDNKKGTIMSNDHGIDGYGIFESDEFRTSKIVIQCKRYTDGCVGEPEIDKFRGVISKFSADYGIFITTSYFSEKAKEAANQYNPTITLIDGQQLVKLIVKYELGVTEIPVPFYQIDDYYNEKD